MTANPWDGVERRAGCPHRPRIAIIFDPVEWRRKIYDAPGGTDIPLVAAQPGAETQETDAARMAQQGEQAQTHGASDAS